MKWYLIDSDDGIIDEAEKKVILMYRYGFGPAKKCGKAYCVYKRTNDGIGGNYWIVKETDLKEEGFEWVLKEKDND